MKKHTKIIGSVSLECFFILNLLRLFLRDVLSDFSLGFIEGMMITTIVISFCYIVACLIRHENPFKIHNT
mgnify:CR=1 FL=1